MVGGGGVGQAVSQNEHLLWYPRFAHGLSPKVALDAEAEVQRDGLRQRLLDGAARWSSMIGTWPDSRLHGELSCTRTTGEAVSLPFTETLA